MQELDGIPEEFFDELLQELAVQSRAYFDRLKSSVASNDREQIRRLVHAIKGAAGNLRIYTVESAAAAFEEAVGSNPLDRPEVSARLDFLEKSVADLEREV